MSDDELTLDDAGEVTLPIVELLTGRGFITGKSGSGKSNTASVIAEELLDRGFPLLIVDTDGEYWGLKEQYEILHVGADEECDLQVGAEHAEKLASLALQDNVPIILDVSGYIDQSAANDLVREVSRHLFTREKKRKKPFLMLVEEIHEYIPEGGGLDDTGDMLVKIGKRGRKHGLGLCGISQRPADVKKDFITQCDWLVWHRLTWDNDTQVVRRVVGSDYDDMVQDLDDGESFIMADFLEDDLHRVQVRRKHTFDAGATPDLEEFERPDLKSVSGDLVDELEEISAREDQRQDQIAQLERQLDQREETIESLQDELEQARDMSDMAEQFSEALMSAAGPDDGGEALQAKIDEIREEKNARIAELEQENEQLRDDLREVRERASDAETRVEELQQYENAVENLSELREAVHRMGDVLDMGIDGEADERLRERLEQREQRVDELEAEVQRLEDTLESAETAVTVPREYQAFVEDDVVQDAIEDAKSKSNASPRYISGVVASIIQEGGPVDYETIADYLGVAGTSDVSKAASTLEAVGILKTVSKRPKQVDFDLEGVAAIKEKMEQRRQAEDLMEDL